MEPIAEFNWVVHVIDLGFPIAGACMSGFFIFLVFKFILAGVTNSVNSMRSLISRLESRVDTMNNQLSQIDIKISKTLGVDLDYNRIARSEVSDIRRD